SGGVHGGGRACARLFGRVGLAGALWTRRLGGPFVHAGPGRCAGVGGVALGARAPSLGGGRRAPVRSGMVDGRALGIFPLGRVGMAGARAALRHASQRLAAPRSASQRLAARRLLQSRNASAGRRRDAWSAGQTVATRQTKTANTPTSAKSNGRASTGKCEMKYTFGSSGSARVSSQWQVRVPKARPRIAPNMPTMPP